MVLASPAVGSEAPADLGSAHTNARAHTQEDPRTHADVHRHTSLATPPPPPVPPSDLARCGRPPLPRPSPTRDSGGTPLPQCQRWERCCPARGCIRCGPGPARPRPSGERGRGQRRVHGRFAAVPRRGEGRTTPSRKLRVGDVCRPVCAAELCPEPPGENRWVPQRRLPRGRVEPRPRGPR